MHLRNAYFPNLVYPVYQGKQLPGFFAYFSLFVRCALTRYVSGENGKSVVRNVIFNLCRQIFPALLTPILIDGKGFKNFFEVQKQMGITILLTIFFQFIPRRFFRSVRYLFVYFLLEFLLSFPFGFVSAMNTIHNSKMIDGDLVTGTIIILFMSHYRLGWLMIEDIFYGDMNTFNSSVFPGYYNQYLLGIPVIYFLQNYILGQNISLYLYSNLNLSKLLLFNVHRPKVTNYLMLSYANADHVIIYTIINVVFGIWHFNNSINMLKGMRKEEIKLKKD